MRSESKYLPYHIFLITIILCLVIGTVRSQTSDLYFPKENWRSSSPEEQGMDLEKIQYFIDRLRANKIQRPISSLLVVKNGYLIVNEYFEPYDGSQAHTIQSVTKSITSTLVGVAIQNGHIDNLNQSVVDFFPEYDNLSNLNNNKAKMNLHHALTMRTGQAWTGESHLGALNSYTGDKMKYVLDYKMETEPGKKWYYNSGIAILLGGLLENVTGINTEQFARESLFEPLGITGAYWRWGHRGIPHTGGGLFLKPADMARIGYLYLRNGRWDGKQILPDWWVSEATQRHVPHAESISGVPAGYGYMWWLLPSTTKGQKDIYMAYGHWGQFIFVIPGFDMVVVITNDRSASYSEEIKPVSLLYEYVLPAVLD